MAASWSRLSSSQGSHTSMFDLHVRLFYPRISFQNEESEIPCFCDSVTIENMPHFILHCKLHATIREEYIPKYLQINKNIPIICNSETLIFIFILDTLSSKLPEIVTTNWSSIQDAYKLSRTFIYRMHLKREHLQ